MTSAIQTYQDYVSWQLLSLYQMNYYYYSLLALESPLFQVGCHPFLFLSAFSWALYSSFLAQRFWYMYRHILIDVCPTKCRLSEAVDSLIV